MLRFSGSSQNPGSSILDELQLQLFYASFKSKFHFNWQYPNVFVPDKSIHTYCICANSAYGRFQA